MDLDLLAALNDARRARRAVIVVTDLDLGRSILVHGADVAGDERGSPDNVPSDPVAASRDALASPDLNAAALAEALATGFRSGRSGVVERDGRRYFLNVHLPAPRLVVVGAVHIAQALAPMARLAGLQVMIVDPRSAFATAERFPGTPVVAAWPADVMAEMVLDRWSALAALTHDPKIDEPALAAALAAGCFYVGALGSRKTHARRLERLAADGVTADALARIAAPIGLDIGAATPAEIAVAVLAQVIGVLRGRVRVGS